MLSIVEDSCELLGRAGPLHGTVPPRIEPFPAGRICPASPPLPLSVTDAGDVCLSPVAVGPFSTTSHRPLLKSIDLSFISPVCHCFTVPSYLLLFLDSLLGTADSDSEPQTIKLSCALDSLIDLPPATEQSKYNARRHKVQEGIAEEVARVPYWYRPPPPPTWVA